MYTATRDTGHIRYRGNHHRDILFTLNIEIIKKIKPLTTVKVEAITKKIHILNIIN